MARQPINVHIFLFRKNNKNEYEYAMMQRSDNPLYWQGVAGGVEEGETLEEAARREMREEAGVEDLVHLYPLETVNYLPATLFAEQELWGAEVVLTPMYYFAAKYDKPVYLSHEHTAIWWCNFSRAEQLIYWHDQKKALWELNERLARGLIQP